MAIFAGVPGIEVTIHQNGGASREYDNDEVDINDGTALSRYQASKTVSKYIEAHTGQEFSIKLSAESSFKFTTPGIKLEVFVDGSSVFTQLLPKKTFEQEHGWHQSIAGTKFRADCGNWQIQNFRFEEIKTTTEESHDMVDDSALVDHIGEIAIWFYRASNINKCTYSGAHAAAVMQHEGAVHENVRRVKQNLTALRDAKATKGVEYCISEKTDGEGRPIAIYKFKYRSLAALQSLLVVPHEPEPEVEPRSPPAPTSVGRHGFFENPNPGLVDLNAATPEEQRTLALMLDILRAHGSTSAEVKMENRVIKRERVDARGSRKEVKQKGASLIDLSQD